jgi:hypothetical protein
LGTVWYSAFAFQARAIGRGLLGLDADHARRREIFPSRFHSRKPFQMALMLPGVAHREHERVGRVAQRLADLEREGLLALEPVGVERVEQVDALLLHGELDHELHRVVEVAFDLRDLGAVGDRLREFAERDLPGGEEDERGQPGAGGVGGHGGGGVAGRGAADRAGAGGFRHGDADGHAAVLEGAGRVFPLVFHEEAGDPQVPSGPFAQVQAGVAFAQRDGLFDRKDRLIAPDAAAPRRRSHGRIPRPRRRLPGGCRSCGRNRAWAHSRSGRRR